MSIIKIVVCAALAVSYFTVSAQAADFKRIKKKSEFTQVIVDKKLTAGWGWVKLGSDGMVTGEVKGDPMSGSWKWKNGYYCRDLMIGSRADPNNCQTVNVSGDDVVFIRDKGKGRQSPMKIQ